MATKTEILSQAEQIRTNNTANSNTPALVGGAIKDLITYVGDKTAAEISFAKGGTELESTNVQGALLELYNRVVTAMARAVSAIALAGTNTEELGALDRTVKKHTIAITNLQSALATDETDIDTLQAQVGSISSSLVTMSADIVRAMDKAKAAYNMADNHEDIIPGLDAGIKNNLSKINKNIADISELAGKIAINVRDIAALVSKDSIHDADIASLQTYTSTIDTTFKAFKSTVEQWEAAATSLHNTLSADVNTLKTDVANLKSKKVGNGVQAQSDDIASEAITGPKLASNSVTTGKIAPNTILDNDINPSSFDDNLATSRKLADAKIVGDKLAGKVDKETGMSLIKSTAADALKFAKKNSSGNLDLEEYNDVCVSSLRFRDVHGDSKDLANLLENQNTKVGDLETNVTDLAQKVGILDVETNDETLGTTSKNVSSTTYIYVDCSSKYNVGKKVKVTFNSSVNCNVTPYAYGSGATIYKTYPNISLVANEDKVVEMSIDETQGYYGFGGLATTAGTYTVTVKETHVKSNTISNIYVKGKMFVANGNAVYENGVVKSCNILWADGKTETLVNSNWNDSVMEYATTTVTYDGTTYTYTRQYSELGEIIKETIN